MIFALILGGAFGVAVCVVGWSLVPARTNHVVALGRLDEARARRDTSTAVPVIGRPGRRSSAFLNRSGGLVAVQVERYGMNLNKLRQDLVIQGISLEDYAGSLLVTFVVALFAALFLGTFIVSTGVAVLSFSVMPLAVLLPLALVLSRARAVRSGAKARRRDFRKALSVYFDLVAMCLVAGRGLPEALPAAASPTARPGWPFRLIGEALDRVPAVGRTTWQEFSALGDRIGVAELRDLAAALALVGEDGARIADTLTARAATLRSDELADVDGRAKERDSLVRVAMIVLAIGFLVFLFYPLSYTFFHH